MANPRIRLQVLKATSLNRTSYTPAVGEFIFETDTSTLYIGDGSTAGGIQVTGAGGEANTGSNVGAAGVGPFKQKSGTTLEFRNINAASNKVSVSLDTINDEIDLDVSETNIDHDALTNFNLNEHVDHTSVNINAGTGLSGGGNISSSRTINLANTAVSAGTYGTSDTVATFTVDAQGRLTDAQDVSISILSSQITNFDEAAQDAVGGSLVDSASINFTYSDAGNTITAAVLPAGVDHDSLQNFVLDEHRPLDDGSTTSTNLWSASKINTEITNAVSAISIPVDSVNGQTGVVVLDADDISDATTSNKFANQAQLNKVNFISVTQPVDLDSIESLANSALQSGDNVSQLVNDAGYLTSALQAGDNISLLTNDSGFITSAGAPVQPGDNLSIFTNDTNFITAAGAPVQVGDNVSIFTNDAGYLTEALPIDITLNIQTGNYAVQASDAGSKIIMNNGGAATVTLPNGQDTGFQVAISRIGSGTVTIAATGTLLSDGTQLATQNTGCIATHIGSNQWLVEGRLS